MRIGGVEEEDSGRKTVGGDLVTEWLALYAVRLTC